jgi:predicted nucleotidyltransferase component of viral defense system
MIPKAHITAWRARAPWLLDAQVEQDLIISRAIVELFRVPEIADSLVFRGGTALYKLYLDPPARYSEDIDLVQAAGRLGRKGGRCAPDQEPCAFMRPTGPQ